MQRIKTFIVGAGASREFEFPTGRGLVSDIEKICNLSSDRFGNYLSGDPSLWQSLKIIKRSDGNDWNPAYLVEIANDIRQNMGLAQSIDNFLGTRSTVEGGAEVGKLAIAKAILSAERKSPLFFSTSQREAQPDFARFKPNWLVELFQILSARREGLDDYAKALSSCRFITFNYDRTIEHFFHQATKSYFRLSPSEADEVCKENLWIYHVYGSLGDVTCQNFESFGAEGDAPILVRAADGIKTFTEGVDDERSLNLARQAIREADVRCFLGFGFLPLNLEVLAPASEDRYPHARTLGTAKGVSPDNLEFASNFLRGRWYGGRDYSFAFDDVNCHELISQHSLYLGEEDLR